MFAPTFQLPRQLRLLVAGLSVVIATTAAAHAQPSFNVTLGGTFDSFTPVASAAEGRQNLAGTVNLEHLFADARGRVFYDLDGGEYDSPGDWSYFQHNAGFTYRFGGTDPNDRKLFLNGSAVKRTNGDAWTTAAYSGYGAGLNAEVHPGATSTLKAGYRLDYRSFADYAALTQVEQRVFSSALRSFESRTTLVGELQVGVKHYDGRVVTVSPGTGTEVIPVSSQGFGRGMGPGLRVTTRPVYSVSNAEGSAGLTSALARIAQSLTDRTGVHAQVLVRRTFGSAPPVLVTTPAGFFEDGVYDDPFASDALFLQAGMKHTFASEAEIAATGWWADKDYTGAVALGPDGLDLPGAPLRADRVTLGQVSWTQPLFASRTGAVTLDAELGYRFLRHRSNDSFYNYTSHAVAVGLSIGY
ncbi:MAG: hypothetical protein Q7V01_06145 [Vicinamibacterales bacterium]|nr:hypothetical protein [Vicinamibacterales bacterium]